MNDKTIYCILRLNLYIIINIEIFIIMRCASFFAGVGGIDIAFEQQEFNKSYVSTYKSWLRDGYLDRNNIIEMNKILGLKF